MKDFSAERGMAQAPVSPSYRGRANGVLILMLEGSQKASTTTKVYVYSLVNDIAQGRIEYSRAGRKSTDACKTPVPDKWRTSGLLT